MYDNSMAARDFASEMFRCGRSKDEARGILVMAGLGEHLDAVADVYAESAASPPARRSIWKEPLGRRFARG